MFGIEMGLVTLNYKENAHSDENAVEDLQEINGVNRQTNVYPFDIKRKNAIAGTQSHV